MSLTFTLTGTSSILSAEYFPPIELDPNASYALGLVGFFSYNSIPNIDENNNKFYYSKEGDSKVYSFSLPVGSYEVEDIERCIQSKLIETDEVDDSANSIRYMLKEHKQNDRVFIKANNNTLKCELFCDKTTVYFQPGSFGHLLGFDDGVYAAKKLHESNMPVNIIKVRSIRIECNMITGSYYNHQLSHTLYEFGINVAPGYSIHETPQNIIYMPVNKKVLSNITLRICDQDGDLVNFRNETIVVRLELKKL